MTKVKQLSNSSIFDMLPDNIDVNYERSILDKFNCAYRMGQHHLANDTVRNHAIHINETLIFTSYMTIDGETRVFEFSHSINDSFYNLDRSEQRRYLCNLCDDVINHFRDKRNNLQCDHDATQ
jgi:hypothetical protein